MLVKMGILSDKHEVGIGPQNGSAVKIRSVAHEFARTNVGNASEDELDEAPVHSGSLPRVYGLRLYFEDYLVELV